MILGVIPKESIIILEPLNLLATLECLQLLFGVSRVLVIPLEVAAQSGLNLLLLVCLCLSLRGSLLVTHMPRLVHFLLQLC